MGTVLRRWLTWHSTNSIVVSRKICKYFIALLNSFNNALDASICLMFTTQDYTGKLFWSTDSHNHGERTSFDDQNSKNLVSFNCEAFVQQQIMFQTFEHLKKPRESQALHWSMLVSRWKTYRERKKTKSVLIISRTPNDCTSGGLERVLDGLERSLWIRRQLYMSKG